MEKKKAEFSQIKNCDCDYEDPDHSPTQIHGPNSNPIYTYSNSQKPIKQKKIKTEQKQQEFQPQTLIQNNFQPTELKKTFSGEDIFIMCFTIGMPTICQILQIFWLDDSFTQFKFQYYFYKTSHLFFYLMLIISYYQAVSISNAPIKKKANPLIIKQNTKEDFLMMDKTCDRCQNWKPVRTSHCSTCHSCILQMDHHCPWIVNCVGYRNHRAFLLFSIYMALGSIVYFFKSIDFLVWIYQESSYEDYGVIFYLVWAGNSLIIFFFALMLVGLSFFHGDLAMTNSTTLQGMKSEQCFLPCCDQSDQKSMRNIRNIHQLNNYDRGVYKNIAEFFSNSRLMFWFPFQRIGQTDGCTFDIVPTLSIEQLENLEQGLKETEYVDEEKILRDFTNESDKFKNQWSDNIILTVGQKELTKKQSGNENQIQQHQQDLMDTENLEKEELIQI